MEADKIVMLYFYIFAAILNSHLQVEIITVLKDKLKHKKEPPKIAVLTPYKGQKALVKQVVVDERKLNVDINTINESQGR